MEGMRFLLFYRKKVGPSRKCVFPRNGGGAGIWPAHFWKKRFSSGQFSFSKTTKISCLPSLKLCVTSESFSKMVWIVTNWIHERGYRRTELSRTTPSIIWCALLTSFCNDIFRRQVFYKRRWSKELLENIYKNNLNFWQNSVFFQEIMKNAEILDFS